LSFKRGDVFEALAAETNEWLEVMDSNGVKGFVPMPFIELIVAIPSSQLPNEKSDEVKVLPPMPDKNRQSLMLMKEESKPVPIPRLPPPSSSASSSVTAKPPPLLCQVDGCRCEGYVASLFQKNRCNICFHDASSHK
jgi:hypothetical protein